MWRGLELYYYCCMVISVSGTVALSDDWSCTGDVLGPCECCDTQGVRLEP